jgi:ankyrin repeat protein
MVTLLEDDSVAIALVEAIRSGDLRTLDGLLQAHPSLASARIQAAGLRTPLHVVTDWPGYFPNGPLVARILIGAGADPNARSAGKGCAETPLHWAASTDDIDVARVLLDGGADLEASDGSIGTPLGNAIGYACWHVARLLVARGAKVDTLWHAAALGLTTRLEELLAERPNVDPEELSQALWHACAGGQRRVAEDLLSRGADLNWVPAYAKGTPLDAASGLDTRRQTLVSWLRGHGARSSRATQQQVQ